MNNRKSHDWLKTLVYGFGINDATYVVNDQESGRQIVCPFYQKWHAMIRRCYSGNIAIEQLGLIQAQLIEYRDDYFEKGSGLYVFRCAHYQAHYDNVGMTEPAHWETDFESYSAFPWEEEAEAMAQGEQS